jgi:hypothetical protein
MIVVVIASPSVTVVIVMETIQEQHEDGGMKSAQRSCHALVKSAAVHQQILGMK